MKARQKLNSRSGFTLAETLLAVLILLLVSSIVVAGIPAAQKAYVNVVIGANAQGLLATTVSALREEIGTAWNVTCEGNTLTYYSAGTGALTTLECKDDGIYIQEYTSVTGLNTEAKKSVGEPRLLVSAEAATRDLAVSYEGVGFDKEDKGVIVFSGISVKHGNAELATLDSLKIRVFSVTPTLAP